MQYWSVGVLCFNESATLESVVIQLHYVLQQITGTFEIIIVDDKSSDNSRDIAILLQNRFPEIRTIFHEVNKGIGGALLSIYTNAKYENVAVIPGDNQFDVTEYFPFRDIPKDHFVSFYRKENTSYSLFRNMLSFFNKKLNKLFLGIDLKDVNWTKIYKKSDLDLLDLQLKSSLVESEICAKLLFLGKKVIEVESKYLPRKFGQSHGASFKIVKKAIRDTLILISILRMYKRKQRIN